MAIVGGGIGGVALAVGLLRREIPFHIFEAAPKLAEIGAGIAFGPNAIRAMALLDPTIKMSFDELATKNQAWDEEETWINFRCGMGQPSLIAKIQTRDDAKTGLSSVHRAQFLEALASKIPAERFHFNKRLVDIENGTKTALLLRFDDGTTEEADALIGCDGIRSKCRQLMLQRQSVLEDLSFTNKYVYRGLVAMEKARAVLGNNLSENSQMYLGPGGHVLTYPIEGGSVLNVVAFRDKCDGVWNHDRWVLEGQGEQMRADFAGWGKPVHDILTVGCSPCCIDSKSTHRNLDARRCRHVGALRPETDPKLPQGLHCASWGCSTCDNAPSRRRSGTGLGRCTCTRNFVGERQCAFRLGHSCNFQVIQPSS